MVSSITSGFSSFLDGIRKYPEGVSWLFKNPKYLLLLSLPTLFGFFVFSYGWGVLYEHWDTVIDFIYFSKPEGLLIAAYYLGLVFVYLGIFIASVLVFFLITNILAAPIYDIVSVAVEKKLYPDTFEEVSFLKSLILIKEEIKKALFILTITLCLLLIPALNVLTFPVAAFFLAWDFFDYPLVRRGYSFKQRFTQAKANIFALIGFGLWLSIPFVQFLMLPLAVTGGTMLGLKSIRNSTN